MTKEELLSLEETSFYTGQGIRKPKAKNIKRKKSALLFLISIASSLSFLLFGTSSLLGVHLINRFSEITDVQYSGSHKRSAYLLSYALDGGNKLKYNWDGTSSYKNFSPYLKSRLNKYDIKVGSLDSSGNFQEGDFLAGKSRVLKYKNEIITADNFTKKFNTDLDFRQSYTKARRGRVANFYDKSANFVFSKLGISRNNWSNFKHSGNADLDFKDYDKKMTSVFDDGPETNTNSFSKTKNDKGEEILKSDGEDLSTNTKNKTDATIKATNHLELLSKRVGMVGSVGCTALQIGSLISAAITGAELYASMQFAQLHSENINKSQTKDSSGAAIHQTLNFFTSPSSSKVIDPKTNKEITITGSPLSSAGIQTVLTNNKSDPNKLTYTSFDRITRDIKRTLSLTTGSIVGCNTVRAFNAGLRFVFYFTPGLNFAKIFAGVIKEAIFSTAISYGVMAILTPLIPQIAQTLFSNAYKSYTGVVAGDLYAKGYSSINENLARSGSGQTPLSPSVALAFNKLNNETIALDSKSQKSSPFNISSPHTFLGSIASKILPNLSISYLSPFLKMKNLHKTTLNSLASLQPNSFASSYNAFMDGPKDCENLKDLGIQSNIFCAPVVGTDPSIINIPPNDEKFNQVLQRNLRKNPSTNKLEVIPNSDLAKKIIACDERKSPFGVPDSGVQNALNIGTVGKDIPIINDILDIINLPIDNINMPWITGEKCVANPKNPDWENNLKYLALHTMDTRFQSQNQLIDYDHIAIFKDDFYKKHPLDNSKQGIIARYSGLSKQQVAFVFDFLEYSNIIAKYTPNKFKTSSLKIKFFNHDSKESYQNFIPQISYFDLRTKSYVS